ncbi:MAG: SWIM zinc finger family protein, partial [Myxococcales bacterium]|nr:SWIM zinc finger family protein [Myxococcales bacterium]
MARRGRDWDDGGWGRYVPVAERRARAEREAAKRAKKGEALEPVVITGRTIAHTFWGRAWCDNLERYSDFANRLPRGRTYARNGSVIDLKVLPGEVTALVSGSQMYRVRVVVQPVAPARWRALCDDCGGAVDSLLELLQGRLSKAVMERVCRQGTGLFPASAEIRLSCSCPDGARMCKHVAAVLYGIGARLDERPELLFRLREVDEQDLVAGAGRAFDPSLPAADSRLDAGDDLAALFGVELADPGDFAAPAPPPAAPPPAPRKRAAKRAPPAD